MLKAYRHLYEKVEICHPFTGEVCGTMWTPSKLEGKPWYEHLLPKHRAFYDSLTPIEQIQIALSCDWFNALHDVWKRKRRN